MKGKKRSKRNASSPFWDHDANPTLTGKYNGMQQTKNGWAIVVGEKLVGFSAAIRSALIDRLPKFVEGKTSLSFEFKGQTRTKSGNRFNQIDVAVDGKLIDTSNFKTYSAKDALLKMQQDEDSGASNPKRKGGRRRK